MSNFNYSSPSTKPKGKRDYGSLLGEQYTIPIQFHDELTSSTSCSSNTLSTSDTSSLCLDQKRVGELTLSDLLFYVLGFESNPLCDDDDDEDVPNGNGRNSASADLSLSMLSNFSTAYNIISISLSLQMMKRIYLTATPRDSSICSSALIAGMIVGQLTLGALGDILGRHRAMAVVMLLQVVSAFGSALSTSFCGLSVFEVLACWRFLLGLGCGGVYPLAATLTTESSNSGKEKGKLVALTFSFQGVGYLTVPIVALLVVKVFGETSDIGWRILLGLGSVPGALLTIGRYKNSSNSILVKQRHDETLSSGEATPLQVETSCRVQRQVPSKGRAVPVSIVNAISFEKSLFRKLLGTAGSWLLFDVLFYGNTLFQPVVLSAAFGASESVAMVSVHSLLIALMALPGYYMTVWAVGKQTPRFIQLQGFFSMGVLYLVIGVLFKLLARHSTLLLVVYGSTFFFSNYGPNATTFMLPSMTFSKPCRSTLNGLSAACGKVGALVGASVFVWASHSFGQQMVFLCCSLLSFAGCFLTIVGVAEDVGQHDDDEEEHPTTDDSQTDQKPMMRMVYSHPSIFDMNNGP